MFPDPHTADSKKIGLVLSLSIIVSLSLSAKQQSYIHKQRDNYDTIAEVFMEMRMG